MEGLNPASRSKIRTLRVLNIINYNDKKNDICTLKQAKSYHKFEPMFKKYLNNYKGFINAS